MGKALMGEIMAYEENNKREFDYELFKNPGSEYRGLPFWSWNCRPDKRTIDEQLAIFKEMGFGGVVIHPRDGLDTEYLGEEFMEMIAHAVRKCREMNLICWLYDDDRFPSGAADGFVTKNPNYRARQLRLTRKPLGEGYCRCKKEFEAAIENGEIPRGYYCAAYSVKTENGYLADYRRLNGSDELAEAVDLGERVFFAYVELQEESEWFQGQTYVDTMNPKAVDEFISVTHERYKSKLGELFGTAASAIFTDEPRIGTQGTISYAESDEDVFVPYTDYFAERFGEKYGFDPLDIIPEYIWDRADGDMRGRYIYREMTKECFSEVFMDKICNWCHDNGILMTGHILGEEKLQSQTATVGDAMRTYKNMDIPGVDILIDGREFSTVKQAASVAAQYGRGGVMSELYGVTNWDCTFKTYKLQGDWQAALGISVRIPHLSHMSLFGEAKRDWPASIFYQSPWYGQFPYIENHFSRLNTALTLGKRITRIAVVHPVESMWIKSGNDDVSGDIRIRLERQFKELTELLLYNTLDFDFLSESLLTEQKIEYRNGKIAVGEAEYETIVVPGLITMRSSTADILESFKNNGGKVIFVGDVPALINGSPSGKAEKLARECICIPNEKGSIIGELERLRDVKIVKEDGEPSDNLFYHLRRHDSDMWLFICHVNQGERLSPERYTVKIKGEYYIALYDSATGERYGVTQCIENGYTEFEWCCYGEDSVLLKLSGRPFDYPPYKPMINFKTVKKIKTVNGRRTEPNVVLLDYADHSLCGGEPQGGDEILRLDNKIRRTLGFKERTGMDRQPWATEVSDGKRVVLVYDIYSETDTPVRLALEAPEEWDIYLNGEKADNTAVDRYVDKDIKVVNLPNIKNGKNELRAERMYNEKTMLENMYLLGDFNVRLEGRKSIIEGQKNIDEPGDITQQGMPFYTGNIEYVFELNIEEEGEYFAHIPEFKSPVAEVWVDGEWKGLIAYAPHRLSMGRLDAGRHEVKIVMYGNRFNGFGMLHNANKNYVWYGNGSYRTTGEEWTYDYMLRSIGIMSDIEIEKTE